MDHAESIDKAESGAQNGGHGAHASIPSGFDHGGARVGDDHYAIEEELVHAGGLPMAPHALVGSTAGSSPDTSQAASVLSHWADSPSPQAPHHASTDDATWHTGPSERASPRHFHDVADPPLDVATPTGGGLHPLLRGEMEHRFGEDFSGVSVQRGLPSEDRAAGVRAVAEREHIAADPDTLDNQAHPENKQVLAEELAHIVQKRRGSVVPDAVDEHGPEQGVQLNSVRRGKLEDEAQHAAARAVAGEKVSIGGGARAPARQFSLFGWVKDKAKGAADYVEDKAGKAANWVGDKAGKAANWVGDKVESGGDWLGKKIDQSADWIEDKAGKGASWLGNKVNQGRSWLGNSWLGKGASWVGDKVGKGASWIDEKTDQGAAWLGDKLKKGEDWLGNSWLGKSASWVGDKVGKGASWVGDKVGKGASWVGDKVKKGEDWLGKTWLGKGASWVGDKVGKGASWIGDKLDGGVSWLKDKAGKGMDQLSHTWLGKVGRGIGKVGSALARPVGRWLGKGLDVVERSADYLSNGINKVTRGIGRGIDWAEDKVGSAADWMAKKTAGIPILGTMTQMGASYVKFQSQVVGGFIKGGVDLIGGIANMALHPVDTAKGLFHLAEHLPLIPGIPNPLKLAHNLYDVTAGNKKLSEALNDTFNPVKSMQDDGMFLAHFGKAFLEPFIQAVKDGKPGEAVGRLGFDVLLLIGTDGAGAVGRGTGEALNTAGKLEQGTKVLSELEKAEQGTKVLSEVEKAQQGTKVLSEVEKAQQGTKVLSETEKAQQGMGALREGEQSLSKGEEAIKGVSEEMPPNKKPSGSGHVEEIDPKAEKAYEKIRASKTDVAAVSKQTGIAESTLQRIKDHLFDKEHEIATVAGSPPVKQRFVANSRWSDLWEGAQKGTLKSAEREELMNLLTHENVEATLSQKGLYIYEPEIVGPGGQLQGRPFKAQGAHDLAGIAERDFQPRTVDKMPPEIRQQHLKDMLKATMEVRGDLSPEVLKNMHPEAQEMYAQILKERELLQKMPTP